MGERLEHLARDLHRPAIVEVAGLQRLTHRASRNVLIRNVDVTGVPGERVDPLAARMPQGRGGPGLALGPGRRFPLAWDDLQRDVETAALVAREPHLSHSARSEWPQGAVTSEDQFVRKSNRGHHAQYFAPRTNPFRAEPTR